MPRLGLGLGIGRCGGAPTILGGTMAAVSGPATFAAVGGTWTIGDTSPVLWCHADEGVTSAGTPALVSEWADAGGGEEKWVQATNEAKPQYITDARGHGLQFFGMMSMGCAALSTLPAGSAAVTVAMALEATFDGSWRYALAWEKAAGGGELGLRHGTEPYHLEWSRWTTTAAGNAYVAKSSPFAGTLIARYDGSNLRLRVSGETATPAAIGGTLSVDTLTLGGYLADRMRLVGVIREVAIWDRSLSDAEAAAVDTHLTLAWGY